MNPYQLDNMVRGKAEGVHGGRYYFQKEGKVATGISYAHIRFPLNLSSLKAHFTDVQRLIAQIEEHNNSMLVPTLKAEMSEVKERVTHLLKLFQKDTNLREKRQILLGLGLIAGVIGISTVMGLFSQRQFT